MLTSCLGRKIHLVHNQDDSLCWTAALQTDRNVILSARHFCFLKYRIKQNNTINNSWKRLRAATHLVNKHVRHLIFAKRDNH